MPSPKGVENKEGKKNDFRRGLDRAGITISIAWAITGLGLVVFKDSAEWLLIGLIALGIGSILFFIIWSIILAIRGNGTMARGIWAGIGIGMIIAVLSVVFVFANLMMA